MLANRNHPGRIEAAHDVRGPTVRGSLDTTHRAYPTALFSEAIDTTSIATSAATVIDMAVFADGATHVNWLKGGVFVRIRAGGTCRIAQAFDTGTSVSVSSTKGEPLEANEETELCFDEDFRYLHVISTDAGAIKVTHWKRQLPNAPIALTDG